MPNTGSAAVSGKADGAYPFYPVGRLNRQHYGADLLYRAHRPTHRAHDDKTGKYRYYGAFRHGGRCRNAGGLPISILTTIIGVPVLVYFMCKRKEGKV